MNNISAGTIARTVCIGLALINQVLAIMGKGTISFVEEDIYQFVSLGFTIVSSLVAFWKNNSFTKAAIEADAIMKEKKANK